MDQSAINQKLFSDAIDLYFKKSKPYPAIENLNKILETDKNSLVYSFKVRILKDTGKHDEALKVIDEGLGHDLKSHLLLQLKAEILAFNYLHLSPERARIILQEALNCVSQALLYFEESNQKMQAIMKDLPNYSEYLRNYLITKVDLKALETNIKNLIASVYVLSRVENVEKQLIGERIRTIELLGLFTAIFAFIFSGIQFVSKLTITEAIIGITGIGLVLICFLIGLHMVLDYSARTKHLIALVIILVLMLLGLPFYAKLIKAFIAS